MPNGGVTTGRERLALYFSMYDLGLDNCVEDDIEILMMW
jgi:hypothetical protein